MAPTPRAKRTPFSNTAGQLYPEDDQQDSVAEGEEQEDAPDGDDIRSTPMQDLADSLYPNSSQAGGKAGDEEQDDSNGEGDQVDNDSDEDTSDEDDQEKDSAAPKGKATQGKEKAVPNVINGSKAESYDTYVKTGGSRSWRNNNPGNIEYRGQRDAVGVEKGGRFAKFPTEEAGMTALKKLLGTTYKDWNVGDLMKKYAPPEDKGNDPKAYTAFLGKHGVDLKKPVGQQVDAMAEAIKKQEGWIAGTIKTK